MLFIALVFRLGLVIGCTTGQVVTNYWKAVIGYKFNRQKIRVDDIIQNPLGIEIIDPSQCF
jgi:type IV secretory pathway component VirB8